VSGNNALGTFLRARREHVRPDELGIAVSSRRRAAGLRREEVATLAGLSIAYYVRLEQGRDRFPSARVLDALARALRLNAEASAHMQALATQPVHAARPAFRRDERLDPGLAGLLDNHLATPAYVLSACLDVLAANAPARALHVSFRPGRNVIRDVFLDEEAQAQFAQLDRVRREAVATLRGVAGVIPDDPRLTRLVDELSARSANFLSLWNRHEVRIKASGEKVFAHPVIGELTLRYEAFTVTGGAGQQLIVYHAIHGSHAARSLRRLAVLRETESGALGEADH
jgi:transcriptional regulator with XRE-family HTH domain